MQWLFKQTDGQTHLYSKASAQSIIIQLTRLIQVDLVVDLVVDLMIKSYQNAIGLLIN